MKAMIIDHITDVNQNPNPLKLVTLTNPLPTDNEILLKVTACGVCHTELDEIEGRTPPPTLPVIPGHQVVGIVIDKGRNAKKYNLGDRLGVAWIYSACGECIQCKKGAENLCINFKATGRDANGGYAELMTVHEEYVYPIPENLTDSQAAPLLCAGAIGYRSLNLTNINNGESLGLTGFGASGHLVLSIARFLYPKSKIFVFTRSEGERRFGMQLGAHWAGDISEEPPEKMDCIIDTTPAWKPVIESLGYLNPGGRLVINAIRKEKSDKEHLLLIDYPKHLWLEKEIKSVANITRIDVVDFLSLASRMSLKPKITEYDLDDANLALFELRTRRIHGAKVLRIE